MNRILSRKIAMAFSALCGVGLLTCVLCNILIDGHITWAAYPALAIPFGWLVAMAFLLFRKHRICGSLAALTLLTLPFLYGLDLLTPGEAWFSPIALPIGAASIASAWLSFLALRLLGLRWALLAVYMLQYGVLLSTLIELVLSRHAGTPFFTLRLFFNLLACTALSCLFAHYDLKKSRAAKEGRPS